MSRVPAEFGKEPNFFFGNREAFKDLALDDAFPRWMRVTFEAYARVASNGHAVFRPKALAWVLGDHGDGIVVPTTRQRVREAIDGAVERGLLEADSKALCLVVPRRVVGYGIGKPRPCPRHPEKRNAETVSFDSGTTRFQPVVLGPKERHNRVVSGSGPLFSLPTATTEGPQAC